MLSAKGLALGLGRLQDDLNLHQVDFRLFLQQDFWDLGTTGCIGCFASNTTYWGHLGEVLL